jgi:hypothetical protein
VQKAQVLWNIARAASRYQSVIFGRVGASALEMASRKGARSNMGCPQRFGMGPTVVASISDWVVMAQGDWEVGENERR